MAYAQERPPDVTTLQLEDLMQFEIEPVFGASRRPQPVTEAPASVTIVTADEITRFGYRSLGDILQGVRGFYVSNDRNYSYLGARGFGQPGDYNTRILLLVDGHRINDAIYDQAPIGLEFGLDPVTFERVEIIRGPSSSLYGTSAFFAVVNVITKSGNTPGASIGIEGGHLGTRAIRAQAGGALSSTVKGFIAATGYEADGVSRMYFPEYAETDGGIAVDLDGERTAGVFGKLTFPHVTVSGAYGSRTKAVPTAAYDTIFNNPDFETTDSRGYIDVTSTLDIGVSRATVRAYVDRYAYVGTYPYEFEEAAAPLDDRATAVWWGLDARASGPLGRRQTATAGFEYRRAARQDQSVSWPAYPDDDFSISQSANFWAAYVDDEIVLHPKVRLNVGLRYDAYDTFNRVTPRAALILAPSPNEAVKYLFGTAFRAPNAYELDYYAAPPDLRDSLDPESTSSHEIVWERYTSDWLRTSVSAYWNNVTNLIQLTGDDDGNLWFINLGRVRARGVEFEAEMRRPSGWRAQVSYGLQDTTDRDTRQRLTNSPRHLLQARTWIPGPRARSGLSVEVRSMSARNTLGGAPVPATTLVDTALHVPVGRHMAIEGTVKNVFGVRYFDPGSEEHLQVMIPQQGRVALLGLVWRWRR
jgi:iron complex outermembrane receptor protein